MAGWTGVLAVGLFTYIIFAILMIALDRTGGPVFGLKCAQQQKLRASI